MPQIFQVLRCFKCLVFQIHPTKKSNEYNCKMCGEKQSIKRHYGLGNGQECRLHVQKLNALRGRTEEEILSPKNEDSEEDLENEQNEIVNIINKLKANKSKWSTYIDSDDISQDETDLMDLKVEKIFSQNPQKRNKSNGLAKEHSSLPQEAFVDKKLFENPCEYKHIDETIFNKNKESKQKVSHDIPSKKENTILKVNNTQIPLQRKSKWAQFVEHQEKLKQNETHCSENKDIHIKKQTLSNKGQKLFEICDENDLDAILEI